MPPPTTSRFQWFHSYLHIYIYVYICLSLSLSIYIYVYRSRYCNWPRVLHRPGPLPPDERYKRSERSLIRAARQSNSLTLDLSCHQSSRTGFCIHIIKKFVIISQTNLGICKLKEKHTLLTVCLMVTNISLYIESSCRFSCFCWESLLCAKNIM